jgi:hypothetical protein
MDTFWNIHINTAEISSKILVEFSLYQRHRKLLTNTCTLIKQFSKF